MVTQITVPTTPDWPASVRARAHHLVTHYESCAQAILAAFMEELAMDDPMVLRAAGGMHGGMVSSLTCGIVTGGMMVLGLLMGREDLEQGRDGLFPIVLPSQDLVARLETRLGSTSCREISGVDFTDLDQAIQFMSSDEHFKCYDHVAAGAEEIARLLQELSQKGELFRPGPPATARLPEAVQPTPSG